MPENDSQFFEQDDNHEFAIQELRAKGLENLSLEELETLANLLTRSMPSDVLDLKRRSISDQFRTLEPRIIRGNQFSDDRPLTKARINSGEVTYNAKYAINWVRELLRFYIQEKQKMAERERAASEKKAKREQDNTLRAEQTRLQLEKNQAANKQHQLLLNQWKIEKQPLERLTPEDTDRLQYTKTRLKQGKSREEIADIERSKEFELVAARYIEEGEWFGEGSKVHAASEFDDVCNGSDFFVQLKDGCLLGIDFTTSSRDRDHEDSLDKMFDHPLNEVSYPTSEDIEKGEEFLQISVPVDRGLMEELEASMIQDAIDNRPKLSRNQDELVSQDLPYAVRDYCLYCIREIQYAYEAEARENGQEQDTEVSEKFGDLGDFMNELQKKSALTQVDRDLSGRLRKRPYNIRPQMSMSA